MLGLLDLLASDPQQFFVVVIAIVIALLAGLSFHEFSHAVVGDALGDPTPRAQGRISLNPSHHLDPLGSLMMVLAGFGWAKPVQINARSLRLGPGLGMAVVAVAGPISNFLLAAAFAVPLKMELLELRRLSAVDSWTLENFIAFVVFELVLLNTTLGVFNLLPIPPMDGSRVAQLMPGEIGAFFRRMEEQGWGLGILFLLFMIPFLTNGRYNVIGAIINPIIDWWLELLLVG
jgi:Zn-dependent protease